MFNKVYGFNHYTIRLWLYGCIRVKRHSIWIIARDSEVAEPVRAWRRNGRIKFHYHGAFVVIVIIININVEVVA